jgi:hypothetical protein
MVSAVSQLRVVAFWYALLGAVCSLRAAALFQEFSFWHAHAHPSFADPVTPLTLSIWISAAVAAWVSFVFSPRYLALSPTGQLAVLVVSILLAVWSILEAGRATFLYTIELSQVGWWGIAGACSLGSFLLWRHRRASNNRWRGL